MPAATLVAPGTRCASNEMPSGLPFVPSLRRLCTMPNPFDLTDKVILITGGNGGIGLGMAHGLAAAGASVAIWGRSAKRNADASKALHEHHDRVAAFACDITDEEAVGDAFEATVERFGGVDACFANAGTAADRSHFEEAPLDEWRRLVEVNLFGSVNLLRAAIRHLRSRDAGGSLVVTSSVIALEGAPGWEHYAATKAALLAVVRSLAVGYGRHGIRVNAVLPGWVETPLTKDALASDAYLQRVLPRHPIRRWGRPEDLAGIAVYLASDASAWHTGDAIVVDGGYTKF